MPQDQKPKIYKTSNIVTNSIKTFKKTVNVKILTIFFYEIARNISNKKRNSQYVNYMQIYNIFIIKIVRKMKNTHICRVIYIKPQKYVYIRTKAKKLNRFVKYTIITNF